MLRPSLWHSGTLMGTHTDPQPPGAGEQPRHDHDTPESDAVDAVDTVTENASTEAPDPSDNPDRSVILGRDGRWAAGWALRFIIFVIAGYIAFQLLGFVWAGLLPVLLAILLCSVLWPPTRLLRRKLHFPGALASISAILGFILLIGGIFTAMAPVVIDQGRQLVDQASSGFGDIREWLGGAPLNLELEQVDQIVEDVISFVQEQAGTIASGLFTGLSVVTSVAVTVVVMFVLTFFFLKDGEKFLPWMRRYTGEKAGWHLTEVLTRTWNTVAGYIRTEAVVAFVDALFIGIGLFLLGVPLAFVLAVITFFAGFIPIVGAFSAGALAVIVALATNGFTNALLVLLLVIAVQQLEGNILQPVLQARVMKLHAAVVLLSVTVGGTLFGIVGAFLAVPVAAAISVWLRYHSEMAALRSGELTIEDIEIATARGAPQSMVSRESFAAVRDRMVELGRFGRPNPNKSRRVTNFNDTSMDSDDDGSTRSGVKDI